MAAGTGAVREQPPSRALNAPRAHGTRGFSGLRHISFAQPRLWHDIAVLGCFAFVALLAFSAVHASGSAARPVAIFLMLVPRRANAESESLGAGVWLHRQSCPLR